MANLQQDIHFKHQGGVPDLLPFDDANVGEITLPRQRGPVPSK
jgi:hypothetical protein